MCDIQIRDPIHGFIRLSEDERRIIDTMPFQRLRNIRQLALTNLVYPGAMHTRFEHSLGVMHLVGRAFENVISNTNNTMYQLPQEKIEWYKQILRLIALTHDLGHAPFSHASEKLFINGLEHEDYTEKIICETEIASIIEEIGEKWAKKKGEDFRITPKMICDIYSGRNPGANAEFIFLKSFMDSELDCDKMDYLLRDGYYCGVKYGNFDLERLIESFTVYRSEKDGMPRLAIKSGGIQVFEEFVLARYFMFIQVYFHKTRRYFDTMLLRALGKVLPNGHYPEDIREYLKWDDNKVMQLLKEKAGEIEECGNIIMRRIYKCVFQTKAHPQEADIREFKQIYNQLKKLRTNDRIINAEENLIKDESADKQPHKIPRKTRIEDEKAIIIFDSDTMHTRTISEESEIIKSLTEKIDVRRVYCSPDFEEVALKHIREYNEIGE